MGPESARAGGRTVPVIGLTGGIASGKTTVSRWIREQGIPVVDADEIVHRLERPGAPGWWALRRLIGWPALASDGQLDRVRMARWIFGSARCRQAVNDAVHPLVRRVLWEEVDRLAAEGARIVVVDVPLLIENGLWRQVDQIWVVWATPEQQVERLMARNHLSRAAAEARIASQMPLADKTPFAHVVLDNTDGLDALRRQVAEALGRLDA